MKLSLLILVNQEIFSVKKQFEKMTNYRFYSQLTQPSQAFLLKV